MMSLLGDYLKSMPHDKKTEKSKALQEAIERMEVSMHMIQPPASETIKMLTWKPNPDYTSAPYDVKFPLLPPEISDITKEQKRVLFNLLFILLEKTGPVTLDNNLLMRPLVNDAIVRTTNQTENTSTFRLKSGKVKGLSPPIEPNVEPTDLDPRYR